MARIVCCDVGNGDINVFDGNNERVFRHALHEISLSEWNRVRSGDALPQKGYVSVNGKYYAYGSKARNLVKVQPRGADRYNKDYYGVLAAIAMDTVIDNTNTNHDVAFIGMYAPQDFSVKDRIINAVKGEWTVVSYKGKRKFNVFFAKAFDEPFGGFIYTIVDENGKEKRENIFIGQNTLILDMGEFTTDFVAIDRDGSIDSFRLGSVRYGVGDIIENFWGLVRGNNLEYFGSSFKPDIEYIEDAFESGEYQYGSDIIDVSREASLAKKEGADKAIDIITHGIDGGVMNNFNMILLTGGGSRYIYDHMKEELPIDIRLVEEDLDKIRFANVKGAHRLMMMQLESDPEMINRALQNG